MLCPNCSQPTSELVLDAHLGTSVTIDLCHACQAFWFDDRESLQLTPASTLRLFRLIGEEASRPRRPIEGTLACPRCGLHLQPVQDMQRATRFQYRRCSRRHGRFITFFDFLREKNFLKPMSAPQIEELRKNIGAVNCSNCGASIDLAHQSACGHCGSALSILDAAQAEKLVGELRSADRSNQPVDPALPLRLEQARREVTRSFEGITQEPGWYQNVASSGLVVAGLQSLTRWLKNGR
jgi:hypothetical protein